MNIGFLDKLKKLLHPVAGRTSGALIFRHVALSLAAIIPPWIFYAYDLDLRYFFAVSFGLAVSIYRFSKSRIYPALVPVVVIVLMVFDSIRSPLNADLRALEVIYEKDSVAYFHKCMTTQILASFKGLDPKGLCEHDVHPQLARPFFEIYSRIRSDKVIPPSMVIGLEISNRTLRSISVDRIFVVARDHKSDHEWTFMAEAELSGFDKSTFTTADDFGLKNPVDLSVLSFEPRAKEKRMFLFRLQDVRALKEDSTELFRMAAGTYDLTLKVIKGDEGVFVRTWKRAFPINEEQTYWKLTRQPYPIDYKSGFDGFIGK